MVSLQAALQRENDLLLEELVSVLGRTKALKAEMAWIQRSLPFESPREKQPAPLAKQFPGYFTNEANAFTFAASAECKLVARCRSTVQVDPPHATSERGSSNQATWPVRLQCTKWDEMRGVSNPHQAGFLPGELGSLTPRLVPRAPTSPKAVRKLRHHSEVPSKEVLPLAALPLWVGTATCEEVPVKSIKAVVPEDLHQHEDVSLIDEAEADASFCSAHERFVEAAENLEQEGWRHEFKYKSIRFPSCLGHEDTLQLTV
eukprot:g2474.t1